MIFSIFDSKPMLAYKSKILSSKVPIGKFHKVWQLILALFQSFKFGCRYLQQIVLQLPLGNYRF